MVLLTYVSRVQYSCGIVLVFWFWQEIAFGITVLGCQANLKESSESKELAKLRLQVLVVVKANEEIMRLRE